MVNYPGSLQLKVKLSTNNLYELCQLCLPIVSEAKLPTIKKWKIPSDDDPRSEGLEERLIELKKQIDAADKYEDEELPYISHFILEESKKDKDSYSMMLSLCYYDSFEKHENGHCNLYLYIEKHHTIEDIQKFVDRAVNFARKLIERASVSYVYLDRGCHRSYVPKAPLLSSSRLMAFVSREEVENLYDNPKVFWDNPDWEIKEQYGDRYLLARCLDMEKYFDNCCYRSHILNSHWDMVRAAKPGTIGYFSPMPYPDEIDIFNSGEPRLNLVGYIEELKMLEYSCHLEEGQHIQGWEIFTIWNILDAGQMKDERKVKNIRVVFTNKEKAEREKRPLLEAGAKVIYMNEKGEEVEIRD